MPLFRFHRGGLQESLETTIIVKNKKELLEKISEKYPHRKFEEIKIEPYGNFDKRIGWYTHIVSIFHDNLNYPVGFLSEPIDE